MAARSGKSGMRPYACHLCTAWHIGHKPKAVMRGKISAAEFYAGKTE